MSEVNIDIFIIISHIYTPPRISAGDKIYPDTWY